MANVRYAALLGNVDKTILRIRIGDGFAVEEWPIEEFVAFYEDMHGSAEHDVWCKLDGEWGYGHGKRYRPKNVYVVTKRFDDFPIGPTGTNIDKEMEQFKRRIQFESQQTTLLGDKISKLRLFAEGSLKICVEFFYTEEDGIPEMVSSREETLHCENRLFRVGTRDLSVIQELLESSPLATGHKYISFAIENFLQSYRVAQPELEFISLMLALESIFNDGKQELRNKVARGCAVLLGRTKQSSRTVFNDVRDLYDKRSVLVHTGDRSKIKHADVLALKSYIRKSLLRVVQLGLPKDQLSIQLTEAGFGGYKQIGCGAITTRSSRRDDARG